MSNQKAIVFFARDFLSEWFSKLGVQLHDYSRIYIVVSDREAKTVKEIDPDGKVFNLDDTKYSVACEYDEKHYLEVNHDRYLRWKSSVSISKAVYPCVNVIREINRTYDVRFYLDEPVANFPNYYFSNQFRSAGARCLHYNSSWLPGYGFFCHDTSQKEPVLVNVVSNGQELVEEHMAVRDEGNGLPLYVLPYDRYYTRAFGAIKFLLKATVKKFMRRNQFYLLQSHSSDLFHAKCLLGSLLGGYTNATKLNLEHSKLVIYPMHYEPENILTYFSTYHRQVEVVSQIIDSLPPDYELIIKEHPSQPGSLNTSMWQDIIKHQRVHKIFGTDKIDNLLKKDKSVVVSFGSTMVLESAIKGIKCAVFSDVHFLDAPGILRIDNVTDWPDCLNCKDVGREEVLDWYASFVNKYCFKEALRSDTPSDGVIEDIILDLSR
ncbi:MAG: hypothetical protein ACI8Y9_000912 [Paracoccaceae bacterium]|jgi:hypothetical protein